MSEANIAELIELAKGVCIGIGFLIFWWLLLTKG